MHTYCRMFSHRILFTLLLKEVLKSMLFKEINIEIIKIQLKSIIRGFLGDYMLHIKLKGENLAVAKTFFSLAQCIVS